MKLFRKMWKAFPENRPNLISTLDGESLWQIPEIYDYIREAVIPAAGKTKLAPWSSVDQVYSWNGDGKVTGSVTRLLEGATKQNKLEGLAKEVDEGLTRYPEWSGGRALKAIILVRRGKVEEAKAILNDLLTKEKEIPASARMIIGQELDHIKPLEEIELKLYEGAVDDTNNGMEYQFGPAKRLVTLLHQAGKDTEAREMVLKYARKPSENNYGPGNQAYAGYQRLTNAMAYGQQMMELGFPADAVRFYEEILADTEAIEGTRQVYGGQDQMIQQVRSLLDQALTGMNPKNLGQTLLVLVNPTARTDPKSKEKPAIMPVDLVLLVAPRELDKASITSLFSESLKLAMKTNQPQILNEVKGALAKRAEASPNDLSTAIASALVAITEQDSPAIARTSARLVELVESTPLDPIPAHSRPNARQRADAFRQIGIWLVARECLKNEPYRKAGSILEARALEAARRQTDSLWSLAILRESGQAALDRGDRATAEAFWRQMLRQVLAPPTPSKSKKPDPNAPTKPKVSSIRPLGLVLLTVAQIPPPPQAPFPVAPNASMVATLERFEQAAQLARLASEHEMHELSAEAIRDSLSGGPPVVPMALDSNSNNLNVNPPNGGSNDPTAQQVEELIFAIDASWTQHKMPPRLAYEALRSAVLPESRPGEVLLYPRPLGQGEIEKPRSVGAILARRAVEAGQVDDLRSRIEARRNKPMAEITSQVLAVQLALAAHDEPGAIRLLQGLADRLKRDSLQNTAELACHAAIPALAIPGATNVALPIVENAAKTMAGVDGNGQETLGPLLLSIARLKFKDQKPDQARATLRTYMDKMLEGASRNGPEYSLYMRKQVLATVANEFANAGLMGDTWEMLGRFADAPISRDFGVDADVGPSLSRAVRLVLGLPVAERYALLKTWAMPASVRKSIRFLTVFVPEDHAIPAIFGPMSYPSLGGIASTPTLLIDAAREAGKLDELLAEVKKAAESKVENARTMMILAQISSGRGSEAKDAILARIEDLKKPQAPSPGSQPNQVEQPKPLEFADYLIARAALTDRALDGLSESLTRTLIGQAQTQQNWAFLTRLRRDLTLHLADRRGQLSSPAGPDPGLAYWHPITLLTAVTHQQGSIFPLWAESEGIVSHIAGPQSQFLVFDYPLTGKFEISVDAFLGSWAEGEVGYSGLVFQPDNGGMIFPVGTQEQKPTPGKFSFMGGYNRTTIQVEPGKFRVLINGHLFHDETDPGTNSPWLAFYSTRERQTAFRNLTITGSPEIPREVRLVTGDHLEGWACGFYGETHPPRRTVGLPRMTHDGRTTPVTVGDLAQYNWHARDGVIIGRRDDGSESSGTATNQSRIYYFRPLRDSESITYEFLYEPGKTMAHPSLERLAFLLEPEGVKLHWLNDGGENDWTGLDASNAVDAPEYRRGTGPLPLKPGEWNQAKIQINDGTVGIDLNGVRIFEYPLEKANQRIFGFYHDKNKTGVQVRDIVLRGNWPTVLPANLLARRDPNPTPADRRARGAMVEERFSLLAAGSVLAEARKLPLESRYEALARFVLPNPDHPGFRLRGDRTPTNPAPPVGGPMPPTGSRIASGGEIESPALELVATAKALGKLNALAAQVENARPKTAPMGRGHLAFLAVIYAAQERDAEADKALKDLKPLLEKVGDDEPEIHRWPELIAASATIDRKSLRPSAMALLDIMDQQWRKKHLMGWAEIVRPVRDRGLLLAHPESSSPNIQGWAPVTFADSSSRGRGMPFPKWTFADGTWTHHPGHRHDQLYLTSPIAGNFEVECELTSFDWRETQLAYAGLNFSLEWNKKSYKLRHFGQVEATTNFDPPFPEIGAWYPYKLTIADGTYSASVLGRKLHESPLPDSPDPWLSVATSAVATGGVRNLKITGNPIIPESLNISANSTLRGWLLDYYSDPTLWKKQGDEIVGRKVRDAYAMLEPETTNDDRPVGIKGSKQESVLKYNRPMLEDGEITYEFFYEPNEVMVYPALDRLTFLIEPDGVKIHWMTDAQFDRTGLSPDNTSIEAERRRGPASPPLQPKAWNRLKLTLVGDIVTLTLNDVIIYERPLEPTNQRDFGLFHYADETQARIRNVNYRGQWARTLPPGLLVPSKAVEATNPPK